MGSRSWSAAEDVAQGSAAGRNLVGWWKMEGPRGRGQLGEIKDASGRGNHLTLRSKERMPAILSFRSVKAAEFKASEEQYLVAAIENEDLLLRIFSSL